MECYCRFALPSWTRAVVTVALLLWRVQKISRVNLQHAVGSAIAAPELDMVVKALEDAGVINAPITGGAGRHLATYYTWAGPPFDKKEGSRTDA